MLEPSITKYWTINFGIGLDAAEVHVPTLCGFFGLLNHVIFFWWFEHDGIQNYTLNLSPCANKSCVILSLIRKKVQHLGTWTLWNIYKIYIYIWNCLQTVWKPLDRVFIVSVDLLSFWQCIWGSCGRFWKGGYCDMTFNSNLIIW